MVSEEQNGRAWTELLGWGCGQCRGCCDRDNEPLDTIICGEFLGEALSFLRTVLCISWLVDVLNWDSKHNHSSGVNSVHSTVCLTTGPQPLPKRVLHIVPSSAFSFHFHYHLVSLKLSSSCLRIFPRIPATSALSYIFPLKYISFQQTVSYFSVVSS